MDDRGHELRRIGIIRTSMIETPGVSGVVVARQNTRL